MIGRTEIPKWIGQDLMYGRKSQKNGMRMINHLMRQNNCNVLESLKKNDKIKDFVISTLTKNMENDRNVAAILRVMADKYERTMSEKFL